MKLKVHGPKPRTLPIELHTPKRSRALGLGITQRLYCHTAARGEAGELVARDDASAAHRRGFEPRRIRFGVEAVQPARAMYMRTSDRAAVDRYEG